MTNLFFKITQLSLGIKVVSETVKSIRQIPIKKQKQRRPIPKAKILLMSEPSSSRVRDVPNGFIHINSLINLPPTKAED